MSSITWHVVVMIAIIEDKSVDDRHGMAEYKCPYSARELLPIEVCAQVKLLFCETKDGKLKLKLLLSNSGRLKYNRKKMVQFHGLDPTGNLY